jgi:ABC-2 type transport system permease protein
MKALVIAATNLRRTLRERSSLFFVFLFPMLMILVLGLAFGGSFQPRVGTVVAEAGPLAGQLRDRLAGAGGIDVRPIADERALVGMVERGELEAGVLIPAGYDRDLRAGKVPVVRYLARTGQQGQQVGAIVAAAVDAETGRLRAARFAAGETGEPFETALGRVDALSPAVPAVAVTATAVGEAEIPANLGRFDTGASAELLLFIFLTAMTSSVALIETRRLGVSRRMLATPTPAGVVVVGEALGRLAVAVVQGFTIMLGSALLFRVSWGDPIAATALMLAFSLTASGAGMLIGSVLRTGQQAVAVGILLGLALGALGGTMMPLEFFSGTMRRIAHLTPHAWAVDGFAKLVRHDGGLLSIAPELGVLLGGAAVLLALASWRLRRTLTR